jgi:invasion protein IalB
MQPNHLSLKTLLAYLTRPALALMLAATATSALAQAASFPGGASSLRETYEDWTVNCVVQQDQDKHSVKICVISQEQIDDRTKQHVLAIQLWPGTAKEPAKSTVVLPFGLNVQKDITLQFDDGAVAATRRINTCEPIGCLLDVPVDSAMLAALGRSKALKIGAAANDGGQQVNFGISLKGFSKAYARASELAN